jgi:hypothetical protein
MVSTPLIEFFHQPAGFLELLSKGDRTPLEVFHALLQRQALVLL